MKKLLIILSILLLSTSAFAKSYWYNATALTGGSLQSLDSINGQNLINGDVAIVVTSTGLMYVYTLDADSAAGESSPDVISPDLNAGDKRWIWVGNYSATIQTATGTQISEISTDGTMAGDSDDAVPTEKAVVSYTPTVFPGFLQRTVATYVDLDTVTLSSAVYHHDGTAEQAVYWDSTLTFNFGSGGSNASSTNLGVSEWHYLYIDDSALSGAIITAARLLNNTTAPTWSAAKHGWYNGNDRCFGAFLTNGSSQIIEFFHEGRFFLLADQILSFSSSGVGTDWADEATLSIPAFSRKAQVLFYLSFVDEDTNLFWRTEGQTSTTGHFIGTVYTSAPSARVASVSTDVITSSNLKFDVKWGAVTTNTVAIYTNGFYLPIGM